MNNFVLILDIYDYYDYIAVLRQYNCSNNFYDNKKSKISNKFISDLLKISKKRCFMCGTSLEANTEIGIYAEREHLINKRIDNKKNVALNKCKKNIVPICRVCNGKKTIINTSNKLKNDLKALEVNCDEKENCTFNICMINFKNENFDFNASSKNYNKSQKISFNFIVKVFFGNDKYINQFDLNYRTYTIFDEIFKVLYNCTFTGYPSLVNHIKSFSKSSLDDEIIEWFNNTEILNNYKKDNLIETITLLENL